MEEFARIISTQANQRSNLCCRQTKDLEHEYRVYQSVKLQDVRVRVRKRESIYQLRSSLSSS